MDFMEVVLSWKRLIDAVKKGDAPKGAFTEPQIRKILEAVRADKHVSG